MSFDEVECLVRAGIDNVTFSANRLAIVLQGGIEVLTPMTRGVAIVLVEPAGQRMIGPLTAVMPLAEGTGRISGRVKRIGDGLFVQTQTLLTGRHTVYAGTRIVTSGEKLGPRRSAQRTHKEPVQCHPLRRQ